MLLQYRDPKNTGCFIKFATSFESVVTFVDSDVLGTCHKSYETSYVT